MPRIDPGQLLRTLSVLLAENGGIRSAEEVPRIVQLMQKFSKKLVSKCIYIHILCNSSEGLLELFLSQKGWDLLNNWFTDAIKSQNYHLCGDLVKLFAVCPMNSARLKENVEINQVDEFQFCSESSNLCFAHQAPKQIRQLSCDSRIDQTIKNLALQVLQKWMSVIRAPPAQITNGKSAKETNTNGKPPKDLSLGDVDDVTSSEDEKNLDFDDSKDYNPNDDSDSGGRKKNSKSRFTRDNEGSFDTDDLLADSSDDEEDALSKFYKSRKHSDNKLKSKEKELDERRHREKEKDQERLKKEKEKSKSYSKTELGRDRRDSADKEKVKEIVKKLKEEKTAPTIASLGRIPKLSKPVDKQDKKSSSFGDLLGGLDSKPKPKAAPIKNKNKELMDSLNSSSPVKYKSRSDKDKEREKQRSKEKDRDRERRKERDRERDKERSKEKRERRDSDRERDGDKRSKSDRKDKDRDRDKEGKEKDRVKEERPRQKLIIPEKRSHSDEKSSPKEKKSPKVIKDSGFLGDVLGDIMKEPPRKKKRRTSDTKEKDVKALEEKLRSIQDDDENEKSPDEPEPEKMEIAEETNGNGNDLEFSEPNCELRDVRGILVFTKGKRAKRKVQWMPDDQLVETEYFELDESERVNVFKVKSFEEAKKREAMFEKSKFGTSMSVGKDDDNEDSVKPWKLISLRFDDENKEILEKLWESQGSSSDEKEVQEKRELRVLKSLFFNKVPTDPSEPEPEVTNRKGFSMKEIPLVDQSETAGPALDYSSEGWPAALVQPGGAGAGAGLPSSLTALLSNISPGLLASLPPTHLPPPSLPTPQLNSADAALFAAQKAAAETLAASAIGSNGHSNGFGRGGFGGGGGFRGGGGREVGGRGGRGRDGYRDREIRRPCKFWMERGRCKEEDHCQYPHPAHPNR